MTQELTYSAIHNPPFNLVFSGAGKEVLRITHGGELIFADAGDAAKALLQEWKRLRGADQIDDTAVRFRRALFHGLLRLTESARRTETAPTGAVGANEVGVAELADGLVPVPFPPRRR